jgi:hypothetical protein
VLPRATPRPGFIRDLCIALRHRWMPQELFMIFTAYFDEADTHGTAPSVIIAGFVGHAYQWQRFEKKLSRIQKKYEFKIFHAVDFNSCRGEFTGWNDVKKDALLSDMVELVRENLTGGVTIALEHDRYIKEYRSDPFPKKMHKDSQLGVCFRACIGRLLDVLAERGNKDKVNIVFEQGHNNVYNCQDILMDIDQKMKRLGTNVLGTFTIAKKDECLPLMISDLLGSVHSRLRKIAATKEKKLVDLAPRAKKIQGGLAFLELTPNALLDLKKDFERTRQQGIQSYLDRKKSRTASS